MLCEMNSSELSWVGEECESQSSGSALRYSRPSQIRILRRTGKYRDPASSNKSIWIASVGKIALIVLQMIIACAGYAGFIALPFVWGGIGSGKETIG